jgi:HAMP domain-containing protein
MSDLQTLSKKNGQRVLVFGRDGTALSCAGCEHNVFPDDWEKIASSVTGTLFGAHYAAPGDHAVVSSASLTKPEWDWAILLTTPDPVVSQKVKDIQMAMIINSLAFILAAAGMITRVSQRLLVAPILKLKMAADSITRQEPIRRITINPNDKLGRLARHLEILSHKPAFPK